jgi:hypothetical protein
MKWIRCMIFISVLLTALTLNGEWSINHNAVLICGDTPDLEGAGPKNFYIEGRESYDMFWNDTYLMWELMWIKAKFNLHGSAPDSDRIHVLYGDGYDWSKMGWRYNTGSFSFPS